MLPSLALGILSPSKGCRYVERKAPADTGFPGIVGEGHFSHFATAIPFPHRNLEPFLIFILEVITGELNIFLLMGIVHFSLHAIQMTRCLFEILYETKFNVENGDRQWG